MMQKIVLTAIPSAILLGVISLAAAVCFTHPFVSFASAFIEMDDLMAH